MEEKKKCKHKNIIPIEFTKEYIFPSQSHGPVQECYIAREFLCLDCRMIIRNVIQMGITDDKYSERLKSKLTTK